MNTPTQEQMDYWRNASRDVGLSLAYQAGDKEGYERGRASLLEELRAGGVELPKPDTHCWDDDTRKDVWSHSNESVLDYGDRRAAAAVPQWQPIETAPKDGKCLLAIATDDGTEFGVLDRDKEGNWIHEGEPTFCHSYYFEPTHWMPLPAAPEEQKQ